MPNGELEAVVFALHGFNDYSNAFAIPCQYLAERGIACYAFDQRGFGEAPCRGLWPGVAALVNDLIAVSRGLKRRHGQAPLYLLGESMGGAVILAAMASQIPPPTEGVILSAPAVWARETMNPMQRFALWLSAHTVPWLKVTGRSLGIQASDNIDMLRALSNDPLVIKRARIDTICGLSNLMDEALNAAARLCGPTLVLYGNNDEVIPAGAMIEMLHRLPSASVSEWRAAFYQTGYHMLLRDLGAEIVLKDIVSWIEDPQATLPSGAEDRATETLAER